MTERKEDHNISTTTATKPPTIMIRLETGDESLYYELPINDPQNARRVVDLVESGWAESSARWHAIDILLHHLEHGMEAVTVKATVDLHYQVDDKDTKLEGVSADEAREIIQGLCDLAPVVKIHDPDGIMS